MKELGLLRRTGRRRHLRGGNVGNSHSTFHDHGHLWLDDGDEHRQLVCCRPAAGQFGLHLIAVVIAICTIYVVLGTAMEELSMFLLSVPVFFPLVIQLGFDPHWFGVLIVCVVMVGLISPPVGMNLFVLSTLLPEVQTASVFRGVWPFIGAQLIGLALLITFPGISLWILKFVY